MKLSAHGFTLIELLIVIAILGILATTVIVAVNPAKRSGQARDAIRKSDLRQIQSAFEQYNVDKSKYPCVGPTGTEYCGAFVAISYSILTSSGNYYIKQLPVDPKSSDPCGYFVSVDGPASAYTIFIMLEDTTSSDASNPKPAPLVPPFGSNNPDGNNVGWRMRPNSPCAGLPYLYNYWVNSK